MSKEENIVIKAGNKVGSLKELARTLGVTPQAVSQWVPKKYIPSSRIKKISAITGIPEQEFMDAVLEHAQSD